MMGTNYYVEWEPSRGQVDSPASFSYPQPTVRMHVCKSLVSFQGAVFNSWSAWKNFLTRNEWHVTIKDEYGAEYDVAKFIDDVESSTLEQRGRQYRWVVEHGSSIENDWLCPDGFSFYAGEFS